MRHTQAPMSASHIEQGPYGIETGLYETLRTYVSAPGGMDVSFWGAMSWERTQ